MGFGLDRCLIILATYNERRNIVTLIKKILNGNTGLTVLVIDDSSPDGTADVVREITKVNGSVHLIVRERKLGLGSAYVRGFEWARGREFTSVCTMDSDHSHDPSVLSQLLEQLGDADMVIGSRYIKGGRIDNWTLTRKIISGVANAIARLSTGGTIRDCTSGYRVYSSALLRTLEVRSYRSNGFSMLVELLDEAIRRNARIFESPIVFTDRSEGKSKFQIGEIVESLRTYCQLGLNQVSIWNAVDRARR